MPTRDCVRSSTLAKRLRFLWTRVPNLKFHSGDHKTMTSFSNFFNKFVFTHKGQNINSFCLEHSEDDGDMEGSENKFEIETLIATAIACNVQVIDIHSRFKLVVPQCLFICKTLVDLTLNHVFVNNVLMDPMIGTTVCLPALKKLKLIMVIYESEESLVHLLHGCPALEELTILKENDDVVCLNISSPTLTRLDLEIDCNNYSSDEYFEVNLDTPALKYLKLHNYLFGGEFSAGTLESLTEADVLFHGPPFSLGVHYPNSVLEFVCKLNHVSRLKITIGLLEVPDSVLSALTTEFRNLTKLKFVGDWDGDWRFVKYFLEYSYNLEVLILNVISDHQNWMEPKQVPVCLIYHIRKVRFDDFACLEAEFNVIEHILRSAKVLKRMEIWLSICTVDSKKKSEARKRISLFERASEACQLVYL